MRYPLNGNSQDRCAIKIHRFGVYEMSTAQVVPRFDVNVPLRARVHSRADKRS